MPGLHVTLDTVDGNKQPARQRIVYRILVSHPMGSSVAGPTSDRVVKLSKSGFQATFRIGHPHDTLLPVLLVAIGSRELRNRHKNEPDGPRGQHEQYNDRKHQPALAFLLAQFRGFPGRTPGLSGGCLW